ncbi:A24 family peptidase [Bosea sp. PAMC 26642]|uniref:A24 family peptidase n=1 Tax=Bosea sp. (strain PAMC 26642) TaxID=1792307 RepID=UPI00077052DD|nr:prepilin peptidase [Bosea sp. PAMC 26642]AMJ62717.1 hypothetical protein AXW83_22600 [Bosea sp. PAMC 26642]
MLHSGLNLALIFMLTLIAIDDLKHYRIKNKNVIICLIIVLFKFFDSYNLINWLNNLIFAAVLFPFLILSYAKNAMGGGDVKLIAVALLSTGPQHALTFAIVLFLCILLYWGAVKLDFAPSRSIGRRRKIPFGPGIAGAWIVTIIASAGPWLA